MIGRITIGYRPRNLPERKCTFVIDDSPDCGAAFLQAVKKRWGVRSVHASEVREQGIEKIANILRFLFAARDSVSSMV